MAIANWQGSDKNLISVSPKTQTDINWLKLLHWSQDPILSEMTSKLYPIFLSSIFKQWFFQRDDSLLVHREVIIIQLVCYSVVWSLLVRICGTNPQDLTPKIVEESILLLHCDAFVSWICLQWQENHESHGYRLSITGLESAYWVQFCPRLFVYTVSQGFVHIMYRLCPGDLFILYRHFHYTDIFRPARTQINLLHRPVI